MFIQKHVASRCLRAGATPRPMASGLIKQTRELAASTASKTDEGDDGTTLEDHFEDIAFADVNLAKRSTAKLKSKFFRNDLPLPEWQKRVQMDFGDIGSHSDGAISDDERLKDRRVHWTPHSALDIETHRISDIDDSHASQMFDKVWMKVQTDVGGEREMRVPKHILWLCGAPGAGKGYHMPHIQGEAQITEPPLSVSKLIQKRSKEQQESGEGEGQEGAMSAGQLIDDEYVVELLLRELVKPKYKRGALVDGFPRTQAQSAFVHRLYLKMRSLRDKYKEIEVYRNLFPRPVFHVMVLFIEEEMAVARQLYRGEKALEHNRQVHATGVGKLADVRPTDVKPDLARERYRNFIKHVYPCLQSIKEYFMFHFINAAEDPRKVRHQVSMEMQYQSHSELSDSSYGLIQCVPLAKDIMYHARHRLVDRLDLYSKDDPKKLKDVVQLVTTNIIPKVQMQALAGICTIRLEDPRLHDTSFLRMLMDVLAERGFLTELDVEVNHVLHKVDMETGDAVYNDRKVYIFRIGFPRPKIRGDHGGSEAAVEADL